MSDQSVPKNKMTKLIVVLALTVIALIAALIFLVINIVFGATGVLLWVYSFLAVAIAIAIFTVNYWLTPLLAKLFGIDPDQLD